MKKVDGYDCNMADEGTIIGIGKSARATKLQSESFRLVVRYIFSGPTSHRQRLHRQQLV